MGSEDDCIFVAQASYGVAVMRYVMNKIPLVRQFILFVRVLDFIPVCVNKLIEVKIHSYIATHVSTFQLGERFGLQEYTHRHAEEQGTENFRAQSNV